MVVGHGVFVLEAQESVMRCVNNPPYKPENKQVFLIHFRIIDESRIIIVFENLLQAGLAAMLGSEPRSPVLVRFHTLVYR